MIVTSNKAVLGLGRDLRRRHGRHRHDRPAHPPREILSLKGDSYRLRGKDFDARMPAKSVELA
jgi:hypothetical protein